MKLRSAGYLTLILCALLPACADSTPDPEKVQYVERTKAQMIGMSREETSTCLGQPQNRVHEGDAEILTYTFGSCVVRLTFGLDNRVKSADYSLPVPAPDAKLPDDSPKLEDECAKAPEVASCTRWLRD